MKPFCIEHGLGYAEMGAFASYALVIAELREFLRQYPIGDLIDFQGIGEGVENSNFFVDTADGRVTRAGVCRAGRRSPNGAVCAEIFQPRACRAP